MLAAHAAVCSKEVSSWRIAAAVRGKRSVPCVLVIVLPEEGEEGRASGGQQPAAMHLYRAGGRVGTGVRRGMRCVNCGLKP